MSRAGNDFALRTPDVFAASGLSREFKGLRRDLPRLSGCELARAQLCDFGVAIFLNASFSSVFNSRWDQVVRREEPWSEDLVDSSPCSSRSLVDTELGVLSRESDS